MSDSSSLRGALGILAVALTFGCGRCVERAGPVVTQAGAPHAAYFAPIEIEDLRCPAPRSSESSVLCGQAFFGELSGSHELLGFRALGSHVAIVPFPTKPGAQVIHSAVGADGRFQEQLPFRTAYLRVCLEGVHNANVTDDDLCRTIDITSGGAALTIKFDLSPHGMFWKSKDASAAWRRPG